MEQVEVSNCHFHSHMYFVAFISATIEHSLSAVLKLECPFHEAPLHQFYISYVLCDGSSGGGGSLGPSYIPPLTLHLCLFVSRPLLSHSNVHHGAGFDQRAKQESIWRETTVFSNHYQGNSFMPSLSTACCVRLKKKPTLVSLQHYVSPAVIHMAIQYAVAFVNNVVAIKIFAMFNYASFGCLLFYCCTPPVCA